MVTLDEPFYEFTAKVALDPVSVGVGAVSSGSGQTRTYDMLLTNVSGAASPFALAIDSGVSSVGYSVHPFTVMLQTGASVTMTASKDTRLADTRPG